MNPADPIHILLVEDDPGDVLLTREALEESKLLHELEVVSNGAEALARLLGTSISSAAIRNSQAVPTLVASRIISMEARSTEASALCWPLKR